MTTHLHGHAATMPRPPLLSVNNLPRVIAIAIPYHAMRQRQQWVESCVRALRPARAPGLGIAGRRAAAFNARSYARRGRVLGPPCVGGTNADPHEP